MPTSPMTSAAKFAKSAPWVCLISLAVIAATFIYNKLYIVAVLLSPIVGLISFILFIAYWRTGKEWLINSIPIIFAITAVNAHQTSWLWGIPQSLAFVALFMALPMLLFRKQILRWLAPVHS